MSCSIVHRLRRIALVGAAGAGLSGCATDPAFWEAMALAADGVAASTASCYYRYNGYGVSEYYCPPSYGYGGPVYVTSGPVYVPPRGQRHDRNDRRDRREWRDRDHDRGGRHDGRRGRGGKGRHG